LEIVVSPSLGPLDETRFVDSIHADMRRQGGAVAMAAEVWGKAGTMQVTRGDPTPAPKRISARVTS